MPKTNLFGHIRASAQFGPSSRNAKNESFWAHSGFGPNWSEQPECRKRMFLGTFGLQANLVPTGRHPPTHPGATYPGATHPPTHPPTRAPRMFLGTFRLQPNFVRTGGSPKTNLFGHIRASAQFGPNSRNAENECFWAHSGFRPIWSQPGATHPPTHPGATYPGATHPPTRAPRMFLGRFRLQPNLVRTAGMPKTNLFGHIRASAQFGPNSRNAENECFWAHSGFRPIWSQPGATHPPTRAPPTRAPPTHPPTHPPGRHECFWADSGFSPIWSEQPECQKRTFLGTFGLRPNLVRTAGIPKTNVFGHIRASGQFGPNRAPPTHPPGRHLPGRHPPIHPPTHPGATNVFGQIPASAQFGPNSRNAKNESFWAHSGFGPIWSEQPECRKRMFLGTFGLQANLVPTGRHPPTHPGATYPGATHPPTRAPRMFLGRFRLQPNLVRTAGMPKTNLFGHIRASAQFGPNSRNAENECFWAHSGFRPIWSQPGATHPPTQAPPTRAPPTHPPGRHECFWADSGFSPIWSEQPECQKRIFLGTFGLRPNLVRTAGMPKTNVFGHIRASGQFGPNRAPPTHPPGRHLPGRHPSTHPPTHPGATNVFGQIPASAQFGPNSRNAKNESFWAPLGFGPIWSEQPECRNRMFLGTFGLQANLVPTGRHPPTHPGATYPGATHPPTRAPRMFLGRFRLQPSLVRTAGMPKTNLFGHIRASAQFGPNSRNAENECFWAHSGFRPIWSQPGATHPPTHPPTRAPRMFLGRFRLQPNLVRTAGMPKTNLFGHIRASAQFGPNSRNAENECFWAHSGFRPIWSQPGATHPPTRAPPTRAPPTHPPSRPPGRHECFWADSGFSPIWSEQPECQKRIFLGTFGLRPNLVRTAGMPKTNLFGHIRASAQFGPNSRNAENECFWAHSGFRPIWSQPGATHPPTRAPPTRAPPTHPPGRHECFWADSGFSPIWSEQPECQKRIFLGTFGLRPNLVRTAGMPKTNVFGHIRASGQFGPNRAPPTHPPGRHLPGRHPPTHPPTHPGATNVFGQIPASAQIGPNSRNAKNESFWAHSGFGPIWSEQPECRKQRFLGTFGLQANLVPTGRHPPTHPGATYPGATHPPTRAPRMFLGRFRLQPNLVRTAGMPKTNLFGHIRASAQFGPNSRNAENECFWAHSGFRPIWSQPGATHPPIRAPPTRAPPTHPPTHPPGRHECFWADSGFSPNWSEQPEWQKRMFLGTFGLRPNLVRTAGMPKTNVFGHIRASGQFGPNRAPPTHPPGRHLPGRHPPTHPPTHPGARNVSGQIPASAQFGPHSRNAKNESFWAHSGFGPIWSEQPECRKRMFLGTFGLQANLVPTGRHPPTHPGATYPGATHPPTQPATRAPRMFLGRFRLQPNLVRTAGMPKTNLFGHIRASAQFGPNSRKAKNESFWAHSGFGPIWSEQPECRKRMFLGTFGLQANLVPTGRHPPTHPGATYPGATHPPTHPPTRAPRMFLGRFRLQPNLVRTAGMPKTNLFGHIRASAQFGPNSRNAENECFWAHSGFRPIWSQPGATHPPTRAPPTRAPPTHPPTHPPGRHECFWADSGFSPIWSEQPECQKRIFLGTFGLRPNLVRTAGMPKTNVFGHIRASGQFGPNRAPPTHPPGRHLPGRHPPTHPGATNVFGQIPASAQFGPKSRNAKNESFWAHSGFGPIWSEQPECRKPMFLGRFRLQPKLVRTAGMAKTNVFGHIRASAQFGPNSRNAENQCFWAHSGFRPIWSQPGATHPPTRAPPTRAPPTHPPTHPPGRQECFWADSGFSPIWSAQPECQKRIFLGTFGLRPNLVRTAGMPKTNVFGHIRASGQFGPNRAPPTHPPGRHLPGRHPPTHPTGHPGATNVFGQIPASAEFGPNSRNAKNESFWAHSGFGPIWSEQPESQKRIFLGTFGLRPNLVRAAGMPKTNVFGHIRASGQFGPNRAPPTHPPGRHLPGRHPPTHPPTHPGATNVSGQIPASAQFGPNSRNAKNEPFWAHSGFGPVWSEQPECRKRMFLGTFGLQANLVPTGRHPPTHPGATYPGATHPPTHPPTRAPRMFLGRFRLQPNLVRTAGMPKTNLFGHIRASAQFGPNSRNAENECFWAHSGFRPIWSQPGATHPPTRAPPTRAPPTHPPTHPPGRHECFWADSGFSPIWSEQPECQKRTFLGTFGLRPSLVRTAGMPKTNVFGHIRASGQFGPNRAPPTHPPGRHLPGRHPPTHPPTHPGATNVSGQIPASAQFGPNSRNAKNESFWAHSGFGPIWSEQPECRKRMFLGTFGLQANLVPTGRHPPTHPGATYPGATHPPTRAPRMFLGRFRLQPNLVRKAGMPKTNLFGHIRASAQFGPNSRNAENECFWAHSGFRPVWSQPGATHPPTRAPPTRAPPTHPPGRHECFWADSGFSPIWSEQPECQKRIFLGTFGLRPNLVRTAGMPKTNVFGHIRASGQFGPNRAPPTHPPGRHLPGRHPTTHPAGHPGARKVFGHIPASAQFGPNSRNAKNASFWAPSGFGPIWSEQPECRKRMFLGTFGLHASLVPTGRHPPTHPGATYPGATHPPTRGPRMFLGRFRLQPNLVRTAGMPKTNLFGHIRASAQFGPNSQNAENECFWAHSGFRPIWSRPGATHPPIRAPPTRAPPTHPPGRHECFWADSGFSPISSEQPECQKRIFLGTFGLRPNLVQTAGMPKTNVFGHIRASGQFGPNRAPPTHPPGRHLPGRHPPTHPPTHPGATNVFGQIPASAQFGPNSRNAKNGSFWAPLGFGPIWSEQPECRKRMFLGTFGLQANLVPTGRHPPTHPGATYPGATHPPTRAPRMFLGRFRLQPNLVRTAGMPKTNLFGHLRASAQFGPNSRNAENECFWAHSGFRPIWSQPAPPTHPPGRHLPGRHPPTQPGRPPGRHECFWADSGFSPIWSEQPECQKRIFLGTFGLRPNLVRTAGMPKTNVFGHIRASGQFGPDRAPPTHPPGRHLPGRHPPTHPGATSVSGQIPASAQFRPNSRNAKKESFWAHSGFGPIWSEQPECQKRMFLGTFGLQANLVPTGRHPPTHPGATYPGATHPPTHPPTRAPRMFLGRFRLQPNLVRTAGMPKTDLFGHLWASAQFGPNSRNAENECFWAPSGFRPIWSQPGATHPPTRAPPTRAPPTHPPGRHECFWADSGFSPIWSEQPECQKRIFLGTFGLRPNLVRTAGMPKTNVFGHIRASGQFGPNRAPPTHPPGRHLPGRHPPTQPGRPPGRHECFWADSGFSPIWSEQPECQKRIFLGTFGLRPNLVRTAGMPKTNVFGHIRASGQFGPNQAPPTHPPGRHLPGRHPPTYPGATNVFGQIPASAQFGPNSRNAKNECFWAHSGFRPIWSQPGATHPPTRAPPTRAPPTHPPGRHECFWADSGLSPIWSEQPECQKRIFLGTFGLRPNLVRTAGMPKTNVFGHIRASGQFGPNRAPPTHPPGRHLPGRHPPTHPGATNVSGQIPASAQFGPNSRNAKNESFWAHSGFGPIWSEQPECRKRMFLGTFGLQANLVPTGRHPPTHPGATYPGATQPPTHPPTRAPRMFLGRFRLQPNLVRTAGMPKTNLFGHIRAAAQFGPNSRNAENECFWAPSGFRPIWSQPGATHPPTRAPPTRAPPTHPPGRHECFWADSGFSPIWSEQPECQKRIFLGTFGLRPNLVRTAGMPKTNVFGHIRASGQFGPNRAPPTHPPGRHLPGRHPPTHPGATNVSGQIPASAQFGPNSRNAKNESFWAHSGFGPIWSEQPECRKRMFLGTFGLQANLVPTGRHPPTHPGATYPGATHPPTHPPTRAPRMFLGRFRLQPNFVRTAGMPKTNLFGHIRASAQFGPNSRNAENECFWAHSGFRPIWSQPGATHPPTRAPPTRAPPTHPPTHPPGRHECFWADSGFSPIWSEQPECQKRIFLGTFGLRPNLVRTAGMPKTNVFGHIRASGQFGPNRAPPTHPPGRHLPRRHPPTHQPTHPGATSVSGQIPASAQFVPNSRNAKNESFWAHSGFGPIWSEQPECRKRMFLGTFGLQANLVPTGRHPPTHPGATYPGATHPPTRPATRAPRMFLGRFRLQPNLVRTAGMPKTNLFGHLRASAQFGPNSRNAENECFWAHSGFRPIWSQPGATHAPTRAPPTRAPPTHPPGGHECFWADSGFSPIWSEQPECQKRIFLGTFGLRPNLVRTAGMPKTNVFGHIRASGQFGPNRAPPTHPPGRHLPGRHPPTRPGATNVSGQIPASAQFGPNSRNAKNESFWAHSGFGPIWSEQPECQKRMFLGTFGLQANLVPTGRHPPTHPGATYPGATHPPTHPPTRAPRMFLGRFRLQPNLVRTAGMRKTNLFGHLWAAAQFGPNSRNAENECFWTPSGFRPIWSQPGATHPPTRAPPTRAPPTHPPGRHECFWADSGFSPIWSEQPECQKRIFLGTFGLRPNLVRTAGMPKTNVFGHIRASGQFGPNRAPPTHPPGRHLPGRHPPTHPGATNVFGQIPASAQFGPNSRNAKNESFWAHSGFGPIWSEQPECRKRMFLGTFGLQANLVPTGRHPPTHPGATYPGATHPPARAPRMFLGRFRLQPNLVRTAGMPKTNLFGHIRASAQFGPNSRNAKNECFWAHSGFRPIWSQPGATHPPTRAPPTRAPPTHPPTHPPGRHECFWADSGFSPIWSEQPECEKRIFLGTFGLRPNLVRTAGMPKTNVFGHLRASGQFGPNRAPPTHPPGRHLPGRHPPTHPGATNVFGQIPASAQFGPNSRNAKNESFWAHSGFGPIWSEQPECRKRMFLGTFGLQANLVPTGRHPPTHPGATYPGATHPPTNPPNRAPRMFLGRFRLQPNLVRTAGMPKTNLFGHIRASAQFGPNSRNAENECFWAHSGFRPIWSQPGATHPPTRAPPTRAPPTHPPGRPPGRHECFWADSGFSPIWSEQPECQKRIFLGTFGLRPNLVRTAGMPKTNVFGHIRASGQFGPNRAPPTHPPGRHLPGRHPPTHPGATNVFGQIPASAQFGPNSRNAKNESFWAHSGFGPIWSEQPECRKRMFLGTFGLQASLVPTGRHPPTHPGATYPGATHPPTRAPRMFPGRFRLQPNLVRTAGMPKTNLFGHIRASAQFGPNSRNAENECFWAHSGFRPIWSQPGATHPPTRAPPTRAPPTHPPSRPPGRHECFWADSGFSPIWSEQPECQKRIFLGTFGLRPNLVRTAGMPKTNVFGHIRASGQFGPNRAPPTHPPGRHLPGRHPPTHPGATNVFEQIPASAQIGPNSRNAKNESFWAHSGFGPIWSEQPECRKPMFLGTIGLQANLVPTGRHPPTHPGATYPGATHPPTHPPTRAPRMFLGTFRLQPNLVRTAGMPKTNLFGHLWALAQFGPNSRNAENKCFWAHSGFGPIWSQPGATHPPTRAPPTRAPPTHPPGRHECFWADSGFSPIRSEQPECQKRIFLGTFGLRPNLVRTAGIPKTNVFGHIRASGQFGPNRAPPTHPTGRHLPGRHPPTHPPTHPGATNVFGHIPASAQFGPNRRNAKNESFWAPLGFGPIWSEQPECRKQMFLGTFGLRANLVPTGRHPPTHPGATYPGATHPPTRAPRMFLGGFRLQPNSVRTAGMPKTNLFGHIRASAQFGPNSRNTENECFWAHSGFRPIWSQPGATHPPTRAPPTRAPPTHPPTHPPGRHECFWADSGFSPIWSEQPESQKRIFLGTFGLRPNLVRTAGMPKTKVFGHIRASGQFGPNRAPPTHPPGRHLPGRHPPTHPPTHPGATNVFGQIPASAQFGPNNRNAKNESFWAHSGFGPIWSEQPECRKQMFLATFGLQAILVPTGRHPPTHPGATYPGATHPPTRAPRMFLGRFRLQPNLVRTAGMPKTNLFGHIRASAQFGPNSRNAENECFWAQSGSRPIWSQPGATHPPTRAPPTRAPPTHTPTHPPGRHECFWAHSGFSPIWPEQPECQKRIFLGTFGLRPNLVRTAGMPKTNVFGHNRASGQFGPNRAPPTHPPGRHLPGRHPPGHPGATNVFGEIPASAQFGPNSRNAKNESFWAHSGFGPIWSEQPEYRKRMFLGTFGLQANLVPTGRHPPTHPGATYPGATHPPTHPPTRAPRMFLGRFRLQPNLVRTAGKPKTNLFGHIRASAQFGPNSRNAENESFWAHSGFRPIWSQPGATHPPTRAPPTRAPPTHPPTHPPGRHECFWADSGFSPIWSEQPECQKRILLGTFGLRPNLVRTAGMPKTNVFGHIRASGQFGPNRAPPTHPPGRHLPGRHPPTQPGATNVFGQIPASAQFGPNSRNAKNESFWAHSGFGPIWSEQPECRKRMFLGTFGPQGNLVPTGRHPPTHPGATHPPTRAPPTRAPPTHPPTHPPGRHESFWAHSGFSPIRSEQPECQKRIFLGTFGLRPNLVRTAGMPKTNVFGHIRASGQFGPNRAPPTHPPGRHLPGRHPPTHPPTHPGATNVSGQIPASAQFGPNSRKAKNESFWAHSGFGPIWSEQPECRKRMFLGTFGLQANLVPTGRHPPTHPGATYPGATHPATHPPTRAPRMFLGRFRLQPNLVRTAGMPKTNPFGHIRASAQFGPNSRNAENECFWEHSGFRPIWSQPGATHPPTRAPPTRAPPTDPPGRHECFWADSGFSPIWSEQPECQKRIFLGTFGLRPNLVRTAGMPKTNVFGHIRASGQFGPNRAPPTHPPGRHLPGRHPPTHPGATNVFGQIPASAQFGPNSRNAENECFWAHSGFRPIWSQPGATHPPTRAPPTRAPPTHPPTRAPRMFLGRFRLQPNLLRTAGMPKTNLFGHIRASAQFGPNSRNAENKCFWAHSGLRPIWSQPGATHPPTRAPPTRAPPTHPPGRHDCFWADSGFSPIWSEQPECRKRMFLGTFGLQASLVPTGRHPPTHPGATYPGATHPPTHPPTRAPRIFLGRFRLQPNLVRTAGMPKTNLFGHIRASAQFGPNSRNAENECFWAHSGFRPIWSQPGATHPPTRAPPTRAPPTHPPGRHECFWADSGFSPIWSEQPECRKRMFLGTFGLQASLVPTGRHPPTHPGATYPGATHPPTHPPNRAPRMFLGRFRLQPNLVRTAGMPKTNVFGHIRASGQFGPNRAPPTHPPGRHLPGRHPPTHPGATTVFGHIRASAQFGPNSRNAKKRMILGTFGLQANLFPTGRHPPTHPGATNVFGHIPASAQFGPNSRIAKNESFWSHSGFGPIWSEQPECRKRMFLGTFGLQANLVPTGRHPPTHPGATYPGATHPPTQPPTRAPRTFLGRFRLQPNLVRTAGMPKTNLFGHIRALAQFGPNSRNAENECFWAHSGFRPNWSQPGATHPSTRAPPTRAPPTHPPTRPPGRHECFWADSGFSPI